MLVRILISLQVNAPLHRNRWRGGGDEGVHRTKIFMIEELFKNKYRIKSARLKYWDYSNDGYYFVTFCVKNHECVLGKIVNDKMILNKYGKIIYQEIINTSKIRKNVIIDEFVVMPNHIHLILIIDNTLLDNNKQRRDEVPPRLYNGKYPHMSKISPKPNSLSSIIGSLKSITTKQIHQTGLIDFKWQTRFYDHIIRDDKSLNNIKEYIKLNPLRWESDRNNPNNLK